jgi:hypothetical protein
MNKCNTLQIVACEKLAKGYNFAIKIRGEEDEVFPNAHQAL